MSDIIDINVGETIEEVTINVVDNVIQVNINKVTGGGGSQTLAETLVLGNITDGENISISNGDAIVLDNGSMLKKGTIDAGNGGAKGISQICGVGYEHKWEAGRLYIMNDGGTIIREVSHNLTYTPTATDDVTKGFVQNTRWILDNGDVYVCTDPTEGAAVWEFITGAVPTLQQVTDEGNTTTNDIEVENANYFSIIQPSDVGTENKNTGAYAYIGADGVLGLNNGDIESTLKNTNVVNAVTLEFPDKPTGTYTIATIEDIPDTTNLVPYQLGGGLSKSINLYDESGNLGSLELPNNLTQDRLILFQDKDYTGVADITDIPAAQVNSDWNATSGVAEILNKPTIPSSSTFVPYTGATADLDLGTYNLTADHIALNVNPSGAGFVVGSTQWNNTLGSSETLLKGGNVTLKNGVDLVARIVNKVTPNTTLTKAAYQVVKVSGASGQRLAVDLAQANTDLNSADTLGVVTETIATNQEGFILTVGQLLDVNTTGSLQGETWADGDVLYLSSTTAGKMTNVKPNGSNGHIVVLGYVEYSHSSQGKIYVKIMNGWELDELHNVYISSVANNQGLVYESSTSLWKNKTIDKTFVGLGNVDNTSDANKPVSTAQQTAIDAKVADSITNGVTTIAPSQNAVFDALALKAEAYSNYPFNTTTNYFGLFDIVPTISTSVTIGSTANNTNSAVVFNRFNVDKEITISDFAILHNAANDGASATVTLYIFDDTNAGLPGVKLHQETTATGILVTAQKYIAFTNNITLQKGNYWIALHFRGLNTAGTNPSFIGGLVNQPNVVTSIATYGINFRPLITGATADLSNNPTITLGAVQNLPQIFIKI